MIKVKGSVPKHRTAYLEQDEAGLRVTVEEGFRQKQLTITEDVKLEDIDGVTVESGQKPYPKLRMIRVLHVKDGRDRLLEFFSDEESLNDVADWIRVDLQRRDEEHRRASEEFREARDRKIGSLTVSLEFADYLFKLAYGLVGEVDWDELAGFVLQLGLIEEEIRLGSGCVEEVSVERLRRVTELRLVDEIKDEVYVQLESVFNGMAEASRRPFRWFNPRFFELYPVVLYGYWSRELAAVLGEPVEGELLVNSLDELASLVGGECVDEASSLGVDLRVVLFVLLDRQEQVDLDSFKE